MWGMYWIQMAQGKTQWWAFVNTVTNVQAP